MVAAAGRFSPSPPAFPLSPRRFLVSDSLRKDPYHLLFASMTTNEDPIREWILSEGKATERTGTRAAGGGCINRAYHYETDVVSIGPSMFEGEVLGQRLVKNMTPLFKGAILEPRLLHGDLWNANISYDKNGEPLILDPACYCKCLFKRTIYRDSVKTTYSKLVKNMTPLFNGAILEPCLLHGDLWNGNISYDKNGDPLILDPACYYGHNEAEFGMSWCAGFGEPFYSAYFKGSIQFIQFS
ncbi:hypothetical protein OROMI_013729 [Orobanche minor]